jgi:hypothetical protein
MNVKELINLQICKFANLQIKTAGTSIYSTRKSKLFTFGISYFVLVFCLLFLNSCFSVKYSMSGASISPEIKTLSVAYFIDRSNSGQSTLSQQFTDNLREKCRRQTSLKIITEGGDVSFECEIIGFSTTPTAIQSNDQAAKNRFTVTVHVKFTNNVDPKLSYEADFPKFRDYAASKQLNEVTGELLPLIIDDITEDIFNKAFVNW